MIDRLYTIYIKEGKYCIDKRHYNPGLGSIFKTGPIVKDYSSLEEVFDFIFKDSINVRYIEVEVSEDHLPKSLAKKIKRVAQKFADITNGIRMETRKKTSIEEIIKDSKLVIANLKQSTSNQR